MLRSFQEIVITLALLLLAALIVFFAFGCTAVPADGSASHLERDAYTAALQHLDSETQRARADVGAHEACELAVMRRDARVYSASPFDRIADAWAVHDFMIGPQFNAYDTEHEHAFDAAARALIEAREAADVKADRCAL